METEKFQKQNQQYATLSAAAKLTPSKNMQTKFYRKLLPGNAPIVGIEFLHWHLRLFAQSPVVKLPIPILL